jgi:glutaredoxin
MLLAATAGLAGAQQVFRIVGPDGKVTFSDKPPAEPGARAAAAPVAGAAGAEGGGAALPFDLRQVAGRYPVTLYTGAECAPCAAGRNFLAARGIPYAEKTIATPQDVAALQRLTGGSNVPTVTIGSQVLNGFSEVEWGQFLNAAGYPQTSQLPPGYRQPPATPLVAAAPARPATPAAPARPAAAAAPAAPAMAPSGGSNPAGIQF